uniref:SDR family oxidoreductase n=1 Tax=uncultured Planktosalinus sp. TaxID=1810935 RepID=UPI0030D89BBE
ETKKELSVVNDQLGSPTNAEHLAQALITIADSLTHENSGLYHFSNTGEASWYDFAKAIFEKHKIKISLNAVSTQQFPTRAKRPAYSVLNQSKIQEVFKIKITPWREALNEL